MTCVRTRSLAVGLFDNFAIGTEVRVGTTQDTYVRGNFMGFQDGAVLLGNARVFNIFLNLPVDGITPRLIRVALNQITWVRPGTF
jgi:hypothetical protein